MSEDKLVWTGLNFWFPVRHVRSGKLQLCPNNKEKAEQTEKKINNSLYIWKRNKVTGQTPVPVWKRLTVDMATFQSQNPQAHKHWPAGTSAHPHPATPTPLPAPDGNLNCNWQVAGGSVSTQDWELQTLGDPSRMLPHFCECHLQEFNQPLTVTIWKKSPCPSGRERAKGTIFKYTTAFCSSYHKKVGSQKKQFNQSLPCWGDFSTSLTWGKGDT